MTNVEKRLVWKHNRLKLSSIPLTFVGDMLKEKISAVTCCFHTDPFSTLVSTVYIRTLGEEGRSWRHIYTRITFPWPRMYHHARKQTHTWTFIRKRKHCLRTYLPCSISFSLSTNLYLSISQYPSHPQYLSFTLCLQCLFWSLPLTIPHTLSVPS